MAAEGKSNRAVADVLGVGESTVRRDKQPDAPNDAPEPEKAPQTQAIPEPASGNDAPEPEKAPVTPKADKTAKSTPDLLERWSGAVGDGEGAACQSTGEGMSAQIFTASWGSLFSASKLGPLPVQIVRTSNQVPKFWPAAAAFPTCDLLIPAKWIAFGSDPVRAEKGYRAALHRTTAGRIATALDALADEAGGRPLALCCFCTLDAQEQGCHRRWLSRWWEEQGQGRMPELSTLTSADGHTALVCHDHQDNQRRESK